MSNEGWICPRCGKALAPWVKECDCSLLETGPIYSPPFFQPPCTGDPLPYSNYWTTC